MLPEDIQVTYYITDKTHWKMHPEKKHLSSRVWLMCSVEEYDDDKITIATRERNLQGAKDMVESYLQKRGVTWSLEPVEDDE